MDPKEMLTDKGVGGTREKIQGQNMRSRDTNDDMEN